MTVATLIHSNICRSRCSKSETSRTKHAKKYLASILIFVIFIFGFLYVFETNNIAAKDYKIRELQKEARTIETLNKSLQIEISNLKSINILQANSKNLEMVKAEKVDYVSLPKSSAMLTE